MSKEGLLYLPHRDSMNRKASLITNGQSHEMLTTGETRH